MAGIDTTQAFGVRDALMRESVAAPASSRTPLPEGLSLKRKLGRSLARLAKYSGLLGHFEGCMNRGLTVLTYHRVLPRSQAARYPLRELVMPLEVFDAQVKWLADHCTVLPLREALAALNLGHRRDRPLIAITFDDGYFDNFEFAAEILEQHALRGTFFVTVGNVESGKLLWFDQAAHVWQTAPEKWLRQCVASAATHKAHLNGNLSLHDWLEFLKTCEPETRLGIISMAAQLAHSNPTADSSRLMTREQVIELHRRGHEIGAHSMSHEILPLLNDTALLHEIGESKRRLADWVNDDVSGFCYPNGDHDARVVQAVRDAGFQYACTTVEGLNGRGQSQFELRRRTMAPRRAISATGSHDESAFRAEISGLYDSVRGHHGRSVDSAREHDGRDCNPEIAYLNTRYPSLTHTFIEREIRAVRAAGISVKTFSIRTPGSTDTIGTAHRQAAAETQYILQSPWSIVASQIWALASRPLKYAKMLWAGQKLALPGIKSRVYHLAYGFEAAKLARLLQKAKMNHVHVHMANNGATVALLACKLDPNLRYSLSIHGSLEFINVDAFRLREKARDAVFVRCISNYCRGQVMAWTDTKDWRRMHIVHTGIDVERFAPRPRREDQTLRLLTIGRFDPIKGYPLLLDACRQLSSRGVDWTLDMLGDGETMPEVQAVIRKHGLAERVRCHGAVSQDSIQDYLNRADLLVVSSFMEGVPVVLMEAMAKELAVVATNVAGIPELVAHGQSGLLVDSGSAECLANALERLANDRDLISKLGKAGRRKVLAEFDSEDVGRQMAKLLRQYVGAPVHALGGSAS